jgi:N-acyl-D-amino-acid deacylase
MRLMAKVTPFGFARFQASIRLSISVVVFVVALPLAGRAATPEALSDRLKPAIEKSIALIEKSAAVYRKERQCFGCHHQALPVMAISLARNRGFSIDEADFKAQLDHTAAHLKRGAESYRNGIGQGGKADTAGWAMWTLETGGWKADDTTSVVAEYLLSRHKDLDHWRTSGNRPPTEASDFTTTYAVVRALSVFGTADQQERIDARKSAALKWLAETKPTDTEDRVFRLRALRYLDADDAVIDAAGKDLLALQREDGGWSQTADLESDAYGTATALVALEYAGQLSAADDAYQKGVTLLLDTQREDGSWHVRTRSKPIQTYFETGFPHEKDQFISISATCWAMQALLLVCPEKQE